MCCKLKQRNKLSEYKEVLSALESAEEPKPKTLLTAKSRGQLTNLSKDAKAFLLNLNKFSVIHFLQQSQLFQSMISAKGAWQAMSCKIASTTAHTALTP